MTTTTQFNIEQFRADNSKCPQFSAHNTHQAVIVKTYYTKTKFHYGAQYWTPEMIEQKKIIHGAGVGGGTSEFVAMLYIEQQSDNSQKVKGVIKIKDRVTGEVKSAVYAYDKKRRKMLYHVNSIAVTDKKFDKQFEIVTA